MAVPVHKVLDQSELETKADKNLEPVWIPGIRINSEVTGFPPGKSLLRDELFDAGLGTISKISFIKCNREQAYLLPPPGPEPAAGFTPVQLMSQNLSTERGRKTHRKRSRTVEPVFGQVKDVRECDRFMRRGFDPGRGEWSLICATHNLLKPWRSARAA